MSATTNERASKPTKCGRLAGSQLPVLASTRFRFTACTEVSPAHLFKKVVQLAHVHALGPPHKLHAHIIQKLGVALAARTKGARRWQGGSKQRQGHACKQGRRLRQHLQESQRECRHPRSSCAALPT